MTSPLRLCLSKTLFIYTPQHTVPIKQKYAPQHWSFFLDIDGFVFEEAYLFGGAVSLRLISLEVPDKVSRGQGTRLTCGYDLEGDTLYSIKWYRDDVEFFRYVPTDKPPGQFFPLQGVKVDMTKSKNGSVYIRDISHLTAGIYKCEVSADAPSFQTVSAEKNMAVLESSGYGRADRSTVNVLLVTMLLILQWRYHIW